jgi:hypothetical protein
MSIFGSWKESGVIPSFDYSADPRSDVRTEWDPGVLPITRRHIHVTGNQRLSILADNHGTFALLDESEGLRWWTPNDPAGTGYTTIKTEDGDWGTHADLWPSKTPTITFGPDFGAISASAGALSVQKTVTWPYGESPFVGIQVTVRNTGQEPITFELHESWQVWAEWLNLEESTGAGGWSEIPHERREQIARESASFTVAVEGNRITAHEKRWTTPSTSPEEVFGSPVSLSLESLNGSDFSLDASADHFPTLTARANIALQPGEVRSYSFRFGVLETSMVQAHELESVIASSRQQLENSLPVVDAPTDNWSREARWHASSLMSGISVDKVLGHHTLNQGSTYLYVLGENAAARDPLQHALPLIYIRPDLAFSVFVNTCRWADPSGALPYSLSGSKSRWTVNREPSDQNLWSLWFAAEYLAATGDRAAFDQKIGFHPEYDVAPVTIIENLRRQHRYFVDVVGTGAHGHVRMMNADWNDVAIAESGVDEELMWREGESVLNSAMAATVLPVWATAAEAFGLNQEAKEARHIADTLREKVRSEWNGRWFRRAYGPGADPVGDKDMWLEVQPWALLSGAADADMAKTLLSELQEGASKNSPVGTRSVWPLSNPRRNDLWQAGEGTLGGPWFAVNMTLAWAAKAYDEDFAWEEFTRMTLHRHQTTYPDQWAGTLSGPDSYNAPESKNPGKSWVLPVLGHAMQSFPIGNMHAHAQPLLTYLRLLGVGPGVDGGLTVSGGRGSWESSVLSVKADGSGSLSPIGETTVHHRNGATQSNGEKVTWS